MTEYFAEIEDTRSEWKIKHNLQETIVMVICAVAGGCDAWEVIEDFVKVKEEWFRKEINLKLANGIPSHDTMQRIFGMIKPEQFEKCFSDFMMHMAQKTNNEIISIDGKTLRGSRNGDRKPIHMISAWASENQMVLEQIITDEKSNEITAVPELIDMLDVSGCIVTADAMNCQKQTVQKITEGNADYVLGLKDNHPNFKQDTADYFFSALQAPDLYPPVYRTKTTEKGHGRYEEREYFLVTDIDWLDQRKDWMNLNGLGMVRSKVEKDGETTSETRYYITSLTDVELFAKAARAHWGIENSLHWCLDVVFDEDHIRMRKDHSGENMAIVRHIVLNMLKIFPTPKKMSVSRKRQKCEYDDSFLADVLRFAATFHA